MSLNKRVTRLFKSVVGEAIEDIEKLLHENTSLFDEKISKWEEKANHNYFQEKADVQEEANQFNADELKSSDILYPKQLVDDLKIFDLSPPSSLSEVKKARNLGIKKFHPDKFVADDEKSETAKRILQIYNSAFERLKRHFGKQEGGV